MFLFLYEAYVYQSWLLGSVQVDSNVSEEIFSEYKPRHYMTYVLCRHLREFHPNRRPQ